MLNSALEAPFFIDESRISGLLIGVREKRIKGHFYLVETAREYGGASSVMCAMPSGR